MKLPELPEGITSNWQACEVLAYGRACADAALEAAAVVCDQLDVMSLDPEVCYGSAKECAEAIRVLKEQA